jgi:hypothetical protein
MPLLADSRWTSPSPASGVTQIVGPVAATRRIGLICEIVVSNALSLPANEVAGLHRVSPTRPSIGDVIRV